MALASRPLQLFRPQGQAEKHAPPGIVVQPLGCGARSGTEFRSCSPGPLAPLLFMKGKPRQAKSSAAGKPDCLEISFRSSKESLGSHKDTSGNHEGTRKQCDSNRRKPHCAHRRVEAQEPIDGFVLFSKSLRLLLLLFPFTVCFPVTRYYSYV